MLAVLGYAIKIAISTFIIYLSIKVVAGYNYRNNLQNALITAVILSLAGGAPFVFFFGLIIWVFIFINWYNIGFFKSFLITFVYAIIGFLLQIILVAGLMSGGFVVAKMTDTSLYAEQWEKTKDHFWNLVEFLPEDLRKRIGLVRETRLVEIELPGAKKVKIVFRNGRSINAVILMEGRKGYLVDIADGKSEVVLRKDQIEKIEEP
jgi:hypothetical protein